MEKYYKILRNGKSCHGGIHEWTQGVTYEVDEVVVCESGFHACRLQDLAAWITWDMEVWEIELSEVVVEYNKVIGRTAKLTKRLGSFPADKQVEFAKWCAGEAEAAAAADADAADRAAARTDAAYAAVARAVHAADADVAAAAYAAAARADTAARAIAADRNARAAYAARAAANARAHAADAAAHAAATYDAAADTTAAHAVAAAAHAADAAKATYAAADVPKAQGRKILELLVRSELA